MACTSIMVGKKASADGSVMTSHTADCHRSGTQLVVAPPADHAANARRGLTRRRDDNTGPMERYFRDPTGTIPQEKHTHGYLCPTWAAMNEFQLAIGESTFTGRTELISKKGLIDCENLTQLILERCTTARQAITVAGELMAKYGWCDEGEALTIADKNEVWLLEILGPGDDAVGVVWAAQRVPDDHVGVVANGARIGELDLKDTDHFMASANVYELAAKRGYWDPTGKAPFRFCEAYNPEGRTEMACTRREWRVLDLLAPSLGLKPNANWFPFSVKPEKPVTPEKIMELFRDTYEGTEFDVCKDLIVPDAQGKAVVSPLANPFMPYEMTKMLRIRGGWGDAGERQLARWYCMYVTVTQSRGWLPDPVGGIVWFGYANPAMTTYAPLYAGVTDVLESFQVDGRTTGFSRRSGFWAFRRVATIAAHRWGDMRKDLAAVRDPLQEKFLAMQPAVQEVAVKLLAEDKARAQAYLTDESRKACSEMTEAYWNLGDHLWNKYDEKW